MYGGPRWRARTPADAVGGRRVGGTIAIVIGIAIVLLLPVAGGPFVAQVMVLVGLYILMGLGLNLEVGFAGLLDLGFVAFFAIGAYAMALLTSLGEQGIAHWSFWAAMPVAIAVSLVAGILFGIPVLRVRGDYLAIATLGLGEIVRLLVLSDALRPWLGGSFGVLSIPKPRIAGFEFSGPKQIYYLTLVASAMVAYVAWRLQDSRLGRAWMAIREDEDVAQALGIDLVGTKLLAYGLGGAMGGMGGAIFAVLVGSVFPHSFSLLISINVLVLIILGGLGSLWGVVVGALVLVGLPELLREFGEYRFLVYGIVLVVMMLVRPEGLVPASEVQRELHSEEAPGGTRIEIGTAPPAADAP
jgi:branched-chain amino acid transport system permease protein